MTIEEYISFFDVRICQQLPERRAQELHNILAGGEPKSIFLVLERVVEKEEIRDPDFEKNLMDFYWQFCT